MYIKVNLAPKIYSSFLLETWICILKISMNLLWNNYSSYSKRKSRNRFKAEHWHIYFNDNQWTPYTVPTNCEWILRVCEWIAATAVGWNVSLARVLLNFCRLVVSLLVKHLGKCKLHMSKHTKAGIMFESNNHAHTSAHTHPQTLAHTQRLSTFMATPSNQAKSLK